jgi:glycerate 2-kinase
MDSAQRITNVDQLVSHGNAKGRQDMVEILEAGLRASDPYNMTLALMHLNGDILTFGHPDFYTRGDPNQEPEVVDLSKIDRLIVVGAGKGVQRLAKAVEDLLGDRITDGCVVDKQGGPMILDHIQVVFGAHPVPDEECVRGCQRIVELISGLTERDLVITMVGNGVSSLLTLPVDDVTLDEVRQMTHIMQIEKGAHTGKLNPIRNHLDQLKGGRISRLLQPARSVHICAWGIHDYDFLMDHNVFLHTLTGGSTFEEAVVNLHEHDAWDDVAPSIRARLSKANPAEESVKRAEFESWKTRAFMVNPPSHDHVTVAMAKAEELGYTAKRLYHNSLFEAGHGGKFCAAMATYIESDNEPFQAPVALFGGGEMVVTVGDSDGMGGRNQEWTLSTARRIAGSKRIIMASVDTDGTDGPGHQFADHDQDVPVLNGGIVDGYSVDEMEEAGYDIDRELKNHNTSPILYQTGSGVEATHNVSMNDLTVVLVQAPKTK